MRPLSERLSTAGSLSAEDLHRIAVLGYRTVIDLRVDGTPMAGLLPQEERQRAAELGLSYHRVPVVLGRNNEESIATVRRILRKADGSVVLHCTSGRIAAALALIYSACDEGATLGECFAYSEALGLDSNGSPALLAFWVGYIIEHPRRVPGAPG